MNYIFCATKSEAQAFVERLHLCKTKKDGYTLFVNDSTIVIITGIGMENAKEAACFIQQHYTPTSQDRLLNIGIAAAPKRIPLGKLCRVATLTCDAKKPIQLQKSGYRLKSVNTPQTAFLDEIVDMEAYALGEIFGASISVYKVISDHFEPEKVTKEGVKKLIASHMERLRTDIE